MASKVIPDCGDDRDQRTQFTAGDAMICKFSASAKGYFKDDLASTFINLDLSTSGAAPLQLKKPPIINRGYFARVHIVNHTIQNFLAAADAGLPRKKQIISLGSGFDTLSLQLLSKKGESLNLFEVDFEKIIRRKVATCLNDQVIRQLLIPIDEDNLGTSQHENDNTLIDSKSPLSTGKCFIDGSAPQKYSFRNLHFLCGDLRDAKSVIRGLLDAGLDVTAPTLILTECVMVYLEKNDSENLCLEFSSLLSDAAWVTYDMISPNDVFGKTMLRNLTAGRFNVPGFVDFPTLESQIGRFLRTGWSEARCINMLSVYDNYISIEERRRVARLEIFDEIEEWQMLMSHYSLTISVKGAMLLSVFPEPIKAEALKFLPLPESSNSSIRK
jgi:tRNA wybutosine-synthesizing protein 4